MIKVFIMIAMLIPITQAARAQGHVSDHFTCFLWVGDDSRYGETFASSFKETHVNLDDRHRPDSVLVAGNKGYTCTCTLSWYVGGPLTAVLTDPNGFEVKTEKLTHWGYHQSNAYSEVAPDIKSECRADGYEIVYPPAF